VVVLGVIDETILVVVPLDRAVLDCLAPRGSRAVRFAASQGVRYWYGARVHARAIDVSGSSGRK